MIRNNDVESEEFIEKKSQPLDAPGEAGVSINEEARHRDKKQSKQDFFSRVRALTSSRFNS